MANQWMSLIAKVSANLVPPAINQSPNTRTPQKNEMEWFEGYKFMTMAAMAG